MTRPYDGGEVSDGPPLDRCYWLQMEGEWIVIPGCFGTAHAGPDSCTCDVTGSTLERAENERRSAEAEVERLRDKAVRRSEHVQSLFSQNARLRQRIRELEGRK